MDVSCMRVKVFHREQHQTDSDGLVLTIRVFLYPIKFLWQVHLH